MPRKKTAFEELSGPANADLVGQLVGELKNVRQIGQPIINEEQFPSGQLRVTVIWDKWDNLPMEDRTVIILRAYEEAEGRDNRNKIALASGLTVPEAHAAGMLPYQIIAGVRKGDPVSFEQCRDAMISAGASVLFSADKPQLRFATLGEADAAVAQLSKTLPKSEQVWIVSQDIGTVEGWLRR